MIEGNMARHYQSRGGELFYDLPLVQNSIVRFRFEHFGSFVYFPSDGNVVRLGKIATAIFHCFKTPIPALSVIRAVPKALNTDQHVVTKIISSLFMEGLLLESNNNCIISQQPASDRIIETLKLISQLTDHNAPVAPLWVHIQPFTLCNLSCSHCYCYGGKLGDTQKIETSNWMRFINQLYNIGVFELILSGGELLLTDSFYQLAGEATRLGMRVRCGTNGTLVSDDVALMLKHIGIGNIQVSLDGGKSITHDKIRGKIGAFRDTIKGIRTLRKHGIEVVINVVVQRRNIEEIPIIFDIANDCGCSQVELSHIYPSGRALKLFSDHCFSYIEKMRNIDHFKVIAQQYQSINVVFGKSCSEKQGSIESTTCAAGNTGVCIDQNGYAYPCIMSISLPEFRLGNVFTQSISAIWNNSEFLYAFRKRRKAKTTNKCLSCYWFGECRGFCPIISRAYKKPLCSLGRSFIV